MPSFSPKLACPCLIQRHFEQVDIGVSRTRAPYRGREEIYEIETFYLDMIASAKRFIYFENQYLTSAKLAAAIAKRMGEPDPPEIVIVMPRKADGWLEQQAMDAARLKLIKAIGRSDKDNRFCVYVPVTKGGEDIYVHAKIAIVDDQLLRIGSSNLNNRSQRLDSECDVTLDCALAANGQAGGVITALRHRLLAEHRLPS